MLSGSTGADINRMIKATPTLDDTLERRYSDFDTLIDAVEYAALGMRGVNFYDARGHLSESLTWREVRHTSRELGSKIAGLGFQKGDRIALIAETTGDFICFFIGCQYAGVLPVPLPLPTSFGGKVGYVEQLENQMRSCGASGLYVPDFMADLIKDMLGGLDLRFVGSAQAYENLHDKGALAKVTADDLAYLQYSSGSTRFPHGVAVTYRSLLANTHGMGYHGVPLKDDDRVVSWLPFYHDMGLVGTFLTTLTCQVSVDFIPTEDFARRPLSWLRVLTENKGTISYSPTFGYDVCARRAGVRATAFDGLDLSNWRAAGIGGDMIRPDVLDYFAETFKTIGFNPKSFIPSYGLAECTLGVSFGVAGAGVHVEDIEESLLAGDRHLLVAATDEDSHKRAVVNCGIPLPEYELEIRDEDEAVLADEHVGRLYLRGVSVMREYFNDPETTREVLSPEGWLDTGDMGYIKDGAIYIVGRAKDMIIVNGRNHWPQDIEWAAEQVLGVKNGDVAAISVPGDQAEEVPMLLVQCRVSDEAQRIQFIKAIRSHVYDVTSVSCLVKAVPPRSLPRTSSGKLTRTKARAQYLSGHLQALAG